MAAPPVQGSCKHSRVPPAEGSPESSLTWCLAHIHKPAPSSGADHPGHEARGRDTDKRLRVSQWKALVAIRTQHTKGDKAGIARFRSQGGLRPLLELLRQPQCPRKNLDLALSILGNCCTELETRVEVRKLDGISVVVDILKRSVALETVQNRAARALGNLAMDPESSALIHSAGGVPLLLLCVSLSSTPSSPTVAPPKDNCPKLECAQSAARALLYLADTHSNRLSLLTQGALTALAPLIAPEYPQALRRAALRTLHELTRGCGVECAREVSRSGVLAPLGVMATAESGKPFEELALKTLANMCSQGCLRPLVGSLGVIPKFSDEVKKDPLKSGVFLKALCLCCKEAVNRAKVKESGGLEALISFLSAHRSNTLSRLPIMACVDFVFDESAMEQLQELGLAPLLVARLVELSRGEEQAADKMDVSLSSNMSPAELLPSSCFDSFDFPSLEGCKKEEAGKEQGSSSFLSLRSWLVSEGLISSEGDLLDSSGVEGEWGALQTPPSSSPQTSSPNPHSSVSLKNTPSAAPPKKSSHPSPQSSSSLSREPPPSTPPGSSPLPPPAKTPVSPTKFSSPHRRRHRASSTACLTKVTLDAPPSAPRPAAYHPYHPEPWTPESPILLLLSRFSHATDPSAALITSGVMSGLLLYLAQHQDPSSRCIRMLCRLSCNPNCLQALVRTGSVGLIHRLLCQRDGGGQGEDRQTDRVKAKVKQLGVALLNNLRVQCESGFGSGVVAHVMLSGSEIDKINCALCLPLITSNKSLLKKLLVDSGGLLLALQPLGCYHDDDDDDDDDDDEGHSADFRKLLSDLFNTPHSDLTSQLPSLYFSLLAECLSALTASVKTGLDKKRRRRLRVPSPAGKLLPPPSKRARLADACPYGAASFDLLLLLDDGSRVPASREAVGGAAGAGGAGSEYFRALLRGGFEEAQGGAEQTIRIKDVSEGMLLPVLHYLHGCRLAEEVEAAEEEAQGGGRCQVLDALLLLRGPSLCRSAEEVCFQKTPLGETMAGACRFVVDELQRELEDVCVSLLTSAVAEAPEGRAEKTRSKADQDEENLAIRTSELELTGPEKKSEDSRGPAKKTNEGKEEPLLGTGPRIESAAPDSGSVRPEEPASTPKSDGKGSAQPAKVDSPRQGGGGGGAAAAVSALLPQVYWFSQRYSFPALRRACVALLLGCQDSPRPFPSSAAAGRCLRRLARGADCTDTLMQDALGLVSGALS